MRKNTDEIFILTKRTGYIPHLKTYGPIPNPIKCPISLCMSMIIAGVELYELDPVTKLTAKLTLENLMKDDKFDTVKEVVVNESEDQTKATVVSLSGSVAEVKKEEENPMGESAPAEDTPPSDDEVDEEVDDEDPAEDDEVDATPEEAKEPENPEVATPVEPKPAPAKKTSNKKKK